jgi:hypothetical protein
MYNKTNLSFLYRDFQRSLSTKFNTNVIISLGHFKLRILQELKLILICDRGTLQADYSAVVLRTWLFPKMSGHFSGSGIIDLPFCYLSGFYYWKRKTQKTPKTTPPKNKTHKNKPHKQQNNQPESK